MEIRLKTRNNLIELIKKATVNKVVSSQELIDYIMTLQTDQYCIAFECKYGCGYQEPYGFVPMAGCPIHD